MKKTKTVLVLLVLVCLVFMLFGCKDMLEYHQKFYDNDEMISQNDDSYSNTRRTAYNNVFRDKASFDISSKKFNGKSSLLSLTTDTEKEVEVDIDLKISSGKFKLCIVTPNEEVIIIADEDINEKVTISLDRGKSRLVMVGIDAQYDMQLNVEKHSGITLKSLFD